MFTLKSKEYINYLALNFSTLGAIGKKLPAPGSVASFLSCLAVPLIFYDLQIHWRLLLLLFVFGLGTLAAQKAEKLLREHDPKCIVMDEVAGQLFVFMPFAQLTLWQLAVGFVFFRIFDITKPWPVRLAEKKVSGGLGIMLDDILAGIYAAIALWLVGYAINM